MANGILIVNKPEGWTSQDVVSKLRGIFHERRVGHGGTLDPMATGVLPVFFGRATRAVEFFEHADKKYIATLRLGTVTDTQDISGNVLKSDTVSVTPSDVDRILPQFLGAIEQIPPMYSAIKLGGKKLYELARAGKEVERKPRKIEIFSLRMTPLNETDWALEVHCSKGTYVRTLCHDIGAALGCGGCMAALQRVAAGAYHLDESVTMDELIQNEDRETLLRPIDSLFPDASSLTLTAAQEKCVRNGASFTMKGEAERCRVYSADGEFLALAQIKDGRLSTIKSFFGV
ncbi:MAG: tRNA pseudouridine(55) synthase TruB [Ruminococcaceae bacterium]|nr:tRNA pseudouridine(55) synthase TruB [Oscillospiraceae bacterium]